MPRVLHTAQALVDITIELPHLPERGNNVNAAALPTATAGGAVTIVVAAARTGASAVHGGAHGEGRNGDLVRETLRENGVAFSAPMTEGRDTGSCYVFLEPSAERTFVTCYGAERDISEKSLSTLNPQSGDLVCVSGYSLFPPTRDPLLAWLKSLDPGVIVVLDPGAPFADFPGALRSEVLGLTGVWTSNADEARALTGEADAARTPAALAPLLPDGAVIIVRDGPRGCWVHEDGRTTAVPGFPQVPVDTNGAGDTHTGLLLGERALGAPWVLAARRANAGAAIKVTRKGPITAPHRADIDAFLAAHTATV
ncbi:MAG: PfkB family carbohydrate kinase [Dermabacter sp.]|nr:PfkB family carbohydrate kinase [Dermabacter sp.]